MLKPEQLEIGEYYKHTNGICMFTGIREMNGKQHAVMTFNGNSFSYIPLKSLYLIKQLDEGDTRKLTEMETPNSNLTLEERIKLIE